MKTAVVILQILLGLQLAVVAGSDTYERHDVFTLLREALGGDTQAMFTLGQRYEFGSGVPRDCDKALMWYRRAAEEGDARAMNAIGLWNIEGNCVEKDEPAGIDLLKQAADLGEPAAMFNLARRYAIRSDAAPKNREESAEYFSKAIAGFRKLADAGERRAYFQLGVIYSEGIGIARDDRAALDYLQKAAALNDTRAMLFLASLCTESRGSECDAKKSFEWCHKAAQLGDPLGMIVAAAALESGEGVARDAVKAHEWRLKAADAGLPVAMFLVGRDYEFGNGVGKDADEAWRWFRKAALRGNAPALTQLGSEALRAQELEEASKDFEAAAALGNARANESVDISSKTSNVVTAVYFGDGQRVNRGQVLVQLVTPSSTFFPCGRR